MAGTNSLEIEIHNLFQENASLDYVCVELLSKYGKNETLSSAEVEGISHFLLQCGRFELLQKFYLKCLRQNKISQIPLGFVAEALQKNNIEFTEEVVHFFDQMIELQPNDLTTLKNPVLREYSPKLENRFQNSKEIFQKERFEIKKKMIEQLSKHHLYQLHDQEQAVLQQLCDLFPNDIDVGLLKQAHLERKADQILSRFVKKKVITKPKSYISPGEQSSESKSFISELETNILNLASKLEAQSPDQLYNLSILAYQFDLFDLTLRILEKTPPTHSRDWLMAEVLHDSGRFLDLLKLIETLEGSSLAGPEDIHGATYLKALAYHGLGQKELAIRLLNSLAHAVPYYRSTEALLHEWKQS